MTLAGALAVMIGFAVLVLAGIAFGWARRVRRDRGLVAPTEVPADFVPDASFAGLYVATTHHDKPLERLAIRGLAYRGRVGVEVSPNGVLVAITGEQPVFFPVDRIVGVDRATWTIDRVVERDGLVRISWRLDPSARSTGGIPAGEADAAAPSIADSYLRLTGDAPADLVAAVTRILPTSTPNGKPE